VKITGVTHHSGHKTFAVSFDDGITIILDKNLEYNTMLSVGTDSYYLKNGKWPSGKKLQTRVDSSAAWITKNKNRYKFKVD